MVLDTSLLNTRHYKVCINGKVDQSRERSSALPYALVLLKREPLGRPRLQSLTYDFDLLRGLNLSFWPIMYWQGYAFKFIILLDWLLYQS